MALALRFLSQLAGLCLALALAREDQELTALPVRFDVVEEVASGTEIGQLSGGPGAEREAGVGGFRVLQASQAIPVRVEPATGHVRTEGRLDREALCPGRDPCLLTLDVLAPAGRALFHVEVLVRDVNDHAPRFPKAEQLLEISESAAPGTRVPLDRALDPDAGPNALQAYSLSPSRHFALEVVRGPDGARHAELVVVRPLDRESQAAFQLVLSASDAGVPPRSGSTLVHVCVLDSNDNSPTFAETALAVAIREDAPPGTLLLNLTATDPDQGPNGEVEFALGPHVPTEVRATFHVDAGTGQVRLRRPLDFERRAAYELDVQARDRGPSPIPAHCKVLVNVLDVNDNAPAIRVTWASRPPGVAEGLPPGRLVALVMTSDADSGVNGEVRCSLRQGLGPFQLRPTPGRGYLLVTAATLDREARDEYSLTVLAQDGGEGPRSVLEQLTVPVLDMNDNPPAFERAAYGVALRENNEPPTLLLTVRARDADLGPNSRITFHLRDPPAAGLVAVDPVTGAVSALQQLDREHAASFEFLVVAEDGGRPPLSASATVSVSVLDANDNAPVVLLPETRDGLAHLSVLVNSSTGRVLTPAGEEGPTGAGPAPLLTIVAHDADAGPNGEIRFSLLESGREDLFVLDAQSGQLYLNTSDAGALLGSERELTVAVADRGSPPLETRLRLRVSFASSADAQRRPARGAAVPLSPPALTAVCLAALLGSSGLALALAASVCRRDRKRVAGAYNCRVAETTCSPRPRHRQRLIQKADILLVPGARASPVARPEGERPAQPGPGPPEAPFPLTPTLYRTLRNQRDLMAVPNGGEVAPDPLGLLFSPPRQKSGSRENLSPPGLPPAPGGPPLSGLTSPASCPTLRRQRNTDTRIQPAPGPQHILRSLVRLSVAALAERSPTEELTVDSLQVQQISQLLSLLHEGQFQPRPNHRGNKYQARAGGDRTPGAEADGLGPKDGAAPAQTGEGEGSESTLGLSVKQMFEEELESLLDPQTGLALDGRTSVDPAWVARLSLSLAADYHDNLFSAPDAGPEDQPRTFRTFGKAAGPGAGPEASRTASASAFLSEMSFLFEALLARDQGGVTEADADEARSRVLQRLSDCGKTLGLDFPGGAGV
ncbi:protocadherin-12 [Tachyglossus aculeatus]|uniref:protocadherin-12 n=1 Tax=Tachyglossus aculeatus TaxID=9261 RepID=UPI0018F7B7EE|nr:protocadherin-12 [Tachyglossus aculeatus]